jgi:hypothetical protein
VARLVDALLEVEGAVVMLSGHPCEEMEPPDCRSVSLRANRNVQARAGVTLPTVPETVWQGPRVPLEGWLFEVLA